MDGDVLDIDSMMWHDGQPQAAIIYLAHLSDAERQFIVTTVLGKLITWMRSQQGSSELRLLTYMDEVFGFVPPTAEPPAKRPILTLLKQARAFGVGLLLSTQNPVDLDYKAMSNAGTWCVGRLQTERDKARILEAMTAASGGIDVEQVDARISALDKREFLLHSTREDQPVHFTTRWALSYLRGPMTKEEVASVADDGHPPRPPSPRPASSPPESPEDGSTTGSAPTIADGIPVSALHPATGWADVVGWEPEGEKYHATIAISVSMRFDESRDGIDHAEQWEAVAPTLGVDPESMSFVEVDHDARDFVPLEDGLPFVMPEAPIGDSRWFAKLGSVVKARLDVSETLELLRNDDLDVVSRPGESAEDFRIRCARTAKEGSDDEMAALRDRYEKRIRTARRDYESAVREADSAVDAQNAASSDAILGAGLDLLMGRRPRASTSSNRSAANKVRRAEDKVERTRAAYEDLARDLDDELVSIQQRWDDRTGSIEPFAVGLESDDIDISEIRIVWVRRTT